MEKTALSESQDRDFAFQIPAGILWKSSNNQIQLSIYFAVLEGTDGVISAA